MTTIIESAASRSEPGLASRAAPAASWPAIIAGAFVAAATSIVLVALGSGLGFASVSPWQNRGVTAATFTVTMAIWLIVTQWVASGLGGYIAGRLRTRWIGTHSHEIFFRDTAHGLVTWAVATVLVSAAVATSVFSAVGGTLHHAADAVAEGAQGAASMGRSAGESPAGPTGPATGVSGAYGLDRLFRTTAAPAAGPATASGSAANGPATADPRAEAVHIIANALATGGVPDADRTYLAGLVAARTGISQDEAQRRVDEFIAGATEAQAKAKAAADTARKAMAQASIYTALSMLVGAFIASVAAALGGRLRDEHP